MNWIDFLIYSPISIWALVGAIVLSTVMLVRIAKKVIVGQEKLIKEFMRGNGSLTDATKSLTDDARVLAGTTFELKEEVGQMRTIIGEWLEAIKKIYWFIPLGGKK